MKIISLVFLSLILSGCATLSGETYFECAPAKRVWGDERGLRCVVTYRQPFTIGSGKSTMRP